MAIDRISLLPDDLLHQILYFLDIQTAIKTCVLSKRWTKNLWTSNPTLAFDFDSYSSSCFDLLMKRRCFHHFILQVLHSRTDQPPLTNLTYLNTAYSDSLGHPPNNDDLVGFISYQIDEIFFQHMFSFALLYHVHHLSIDAKMRIYLSPPNPRHCLSTCRSVKLAAFLHGTWPLSLTLPFMESLEIENYYSRQYIELEEGDMFLSCPILTRLILRGPCFARAKITAPKLEYLEIGFRKDDGCFQFPDIVLCTPKLECVKIVDVFPYLISHHHFLSLHKFEFSIFHFRSLTFGDDEAKENIIKRLRCLTNLLQKANSLTLNPLGIKVLSKYIPPQKETEAFLCEKFRNLKLAEGDEKSLWIADFVDGCLLDLGNMHGH